VAAEANETADMNGFMAAFLLAPVSVESLGRAVVVNAVMEVGELLCGIDVDEITTWGALPDPVTVVKEL